MAQPQQIISTLYPFLQIRIEVRGWQHETFALLDTGFEGALAIPSSTLNLGLGSPDTSTNWQLANDSVVEAPVYSGAVEIVGLAVIPAADITALVDEYLLGRGILDRFEVSFDHGQRVIIKT